VSKYDAGVPVPAGGGEETVVADGGTWNKEEVETISPPLLLDASAETNSKQSTEISRISELTSAAKQTDPAAVKRVKNKAVVKLHPLAKHDAHQEQINANATIDPQTSSVVSNAIDPVISTVPASTTVIEASPAAASITRQVHKSNPEKMRRAQEMRRAREYKKRIARNLAINNRLVRIYSYLNYIS
jgi:hypothetical protein